MTKVAIGIGLAAAALWAVFVSSAEPRRRRLALLSLLAVLLLLPQSLLIAGRPATPPVNDGVTLSEAAAGRLLGGLDPYGHDYIDDAATRTFFFADQPVNFAFRHYVYLPVTILLALPGRWLGFGFAWMWLPGMLALALSAYGLGRRAEESEMAMIAVALNPVLFIDFVTLLNDLFFLAAALGALACVRRRRALPAGALLGIALATKQQTVLLLPLIGIVAWRELELGRRLQMTGACLLALGVLVLPFLAWNPSGFLADTAGYSYGSGVDSFPIRGFGLPAILLQAGVIPNRWEAYPAGLVQLLLVLPLVGLAAWGLRRGWSWPAAWSWSAGLAFAVFFGGRYFAPNYLTLVAVLLTLGLASWLVNLAPAIAPERVDGSRSRGRVEVP